MVEPTVNSSPVPHGANRSGGWIAALLALRHRLGAGTAVLYLIDRLLSRLSGGRARLLRYHIVAQPIGGRPAAPLRPDAKTQLSLTPADSPLVARFPRPATVIRRRFASGGQCLSAVVGGEFAGFVWWQHGHYEEDEVRCTFLLDDPKRCVWDYDVFVAPPFRLGRTMARLWGAVDQKLAAQGVTWSMSRISAFNPESLAAHARLGTVHCESATFVVLGQLQCALLQQAPFVHLSWRLQRGPRLLIKAP